ncbi:hypothetical protein P4K49_02425 [Bacillus cereus]|uniref:hypothetical protein n=1 Tax=Bacillus cereus group TaxID=86661 RepID=UPI000676E29E|nr:MULTISPECIES: hypothetical protein [Bacillus cereus group]AKR34229.1 Hypothetical protein NF53_1151 [Bacillus thuringiensis serovar indiana]MBG9645225.1 hypothetical protein [Bacillus thuringiensis]MBG9651261.1 hypothetical protein [Bacillus thuringiensis]MDF9450959.1 hypothetical protein [Bacillus toyonensis]MDG1564746.1 hypothetical protein [Bacillus toyonensis]
MAEIVNEILVLTEGNDSTAQYKIKTHSPLGIQLEKRFLYVNDGFNWFYIPTNRILSARYLDKDKQDRE